MRPDLSAPSEKDVQQKVAKFLGQQRFTVALSDQLGEGSIMLRAVAGACRILVAGSNPIAWDRDAIADNECSGDQV